MTVLLDYSSARPSPAQIKAFGAAGVLRYLCHSTGPKRLSKSEATQLRTAGLQIGLVFEDEADRATRGAGIGRADAVFAAQQAAQIGIPPTVPIFFAVDQDLDPARVLPYFTGCQQARISNPVGVYGSQRIVDAVMTAGVPYGWQTVAWSHGKRSSSAHLLQTAERSLPGTDKNILLKPLPLWGAPPQPHIQPKPTPAPSPGHPNQETDMIVVYVPGGPTALLAAGKLIVLSGNDQVEAYRARGVPVQHCTQTEMDIYAAVSAKL